jgi:hypothetical protein
MGQTVEASLQPVGYQQLTSMTNATSLTPPAEARIAVIEAEAQEVRWRDDGVDPTTTVGMLLPVKSAFTYTGVLASLRFIAAVAGAILNVSYYRDKPR